LPHAVDPEGILRTGNLFKHPAVLTAATVEEMRLLIDRFDERSITPEIVGKDKGYNLIRLRERYYGVPESAPPCDLDLPEERRRCGVLSASSIEQLEAAIDAALEAQPVEFAGWLPIYKTAGNCGQHPQFLHTDAPPPGYRFTCSAPPEQRRLTLWDKVRERVGAVGGKALAATIAVLRAIGAFFRPRRGVTLRSRFRILGAMLSLLFVLLWRGCRLRSILRFFQSRHLQSQLQIGGQRGPVFLTSMPFTFNQNPWLIEIEDPTTLFFPMLQNGQTSHIDIAASPYLPIVKALLEADNCKAILTHMRSTARLVGTLFGSDIVRRKVVHAPLGVNLPGRWQRHEPQTPDESIHLLFINSWCQVPSNFYLRGGLDILEAFATLRIRYPQLRLTMRTDLPPLDDYYHRIIESGWVRIINRFMTAAEMAELHASSHIFLLPAARVHIVSLLQAMSYGLAVVASDGWGMEEYVAHERNGLVVPGRYGKVSWADEQAGFLREDYEPMYTADPEVVNGIIVAVSRLVEDAELRRRLGGNARREVETTFNLEGWNRGVSEALGMAFSTLPVSAQPDYSPAPQLADYR
jgi:glycosyltransferase involved in cell wall biosynthesis